jgi:glycosyltransferase involved in cell wall biosynthesis
VLKDATGLIEKILLSIDMPKKPEKEVIIFRKDLLPLSEAFILDQYLSYETWTPHLAGYRFCHGIDLAGRHAFTLDRCVRRPFQQIYLKAFQHLQYLGISPPAFKRYVELSGAKIIHAHFGYDAILVYDIAKALKIPLVVTLHGGDILYPPEVWESGSAGFFFKCYPEKLKSLFKDERVFFIAVSNALRRAALERGVPADRCVVRYTGTNHRYFVPPASPASPSNKVLFVGRLAAYKGCEFLLKAMSIAQQQVSHAELVVIGDGPEKSKLISMSKDLNLNASFLGGLPRNQVKDWMTKSSVFCLPSITESTQSFETFGMVILEAQFCGLPVITSARGGSESIVHNETGFVFAEKDYETLAKYITALLTDNELRNRFSNEARQHVLANFTLEACTRRIEGYYDEILQLRPKREMQ